MNKLTCITTKNITLNRIEKLFIRVYTGSRFLKEIDGLRYLAICAVLIFHLAGYVKQNAVEGDLYVDYSTWWGNILFNASNGVELFFCISGFILALPMLENPQGLLTSNFLGKYLKRRLTRLEPPYVLVMVGLTLILFVTKRDLTVNLFSSLWSSLLYVHNIVFERPSVINVVAWSLEIEFQFYLLAPLLVFGITKIARGRVFILSVLIGLLALFHVVGLWKILTIASFLHFFLIGILLADMFHRRASFTFAPQAWWWNILWLLALGAVLSIEFRAGALENLIFTFAVFLLVYVTLFAETVFKRILQFPFVYLIGGMCYSIYLLHYPVIGFLGRYLAWGSLSGTMISVLVLVLAITIISALFFLFVEKPAMIRDWYKKGVKEIYLIIFSTK